MCRAKRVECGHDYCFLSIAALNNVKIPFYEKITWIQKNLKLIVLQRRYMSVLFDTFPANLFY